MENFNTLTAAVIGQTVNLAWHLNAPGFPPVVAFGVQRKPFLGGGNEWLPVVSALTPIVIPIGTGPGPAGLAPVLGLSSTFEVLANNVITNTGPTVITGDLGMSPGSNVTGFPPGAIAGAVQIGTSIGTQAEADALTAYNDIIGRTPTTVVGPGDLAGQTLPPGIYSSATSISVSSGDLTLDAQGNAASVFIFVAGTQLSIGSGRQIKLINGAQPLNIFWVAGTTVSIGAGSIFQGSIIALSSLTLGIGTSIVGRLHSINDGVFLQSNIATLPVLAPPLPPVPVVIIPPTIPFTLSDTPGSGTWTYRLSAILATGGTLGLPTFIYSNNVNVSTENSTGEITLTLRSSPDENNTDYTSVALSWTPVSPRRYEVQRTFDRGATWKTARTQFGVGNFSESLPPGQGDIFYRVIADLPSAISPYNEDVHSVSNSVTVRT